MWKIYEQNFNIQRKNQHTHRHITHNFWRYFYECIIDFIYNGNNKQKKQHIEVTAQNIIIYALNNRMICLEFSEIIS